LSKRKPKPKAPEPVAIGPLRLQPTTEFGRDLKRAEKIGKDMAKFREIVELLRNRVPLTRGQRDHALKGEWQGFKECHIEGDWLLVYKIVGNTLILFRTGNHDDIF
jgi:mRNA interferase YafQ